MRDQKLQKQVEELSIEISAYCYWSITPHLRYVKIPIRSSNAYELKLQQMWQGSDGSTKWEWVEEIELVKTHEGGNK
jgi:hypothetical protein